MTQVLLHAGASLAHDGAVPTRVHLVALTLVLVAELPILIPPPFPLTDHLVFWKAGQLVLTGGSPYDMQAWGEIQRSYASGHLQPFIEAGRAVWVYPAWTAFLFVPFAVLPYPAGPWALYLSYIAVGLFAAVLFIRSLPPRWRPQADLAIVLVAMFQPFVIANRYGQFGAFLLLGLVLVYIGLRERRALPLAAGALLLFTKPQLELVLAPVVLVQLVRERAWRTIAVVAGALVAVAGVSTRVYPESLAFFARGVGDRVEIFTIYSSTWAFAHFVAGDRWPLVGAGLVALAGATTVAAVRRLPADLRLAGAVAGAAVLSLAVTPVGFHYDQVPLVLAAIVAVAVGRRLGQVALVWSVVAALPWLVFFAELGLATADSQSLSGIVPILFGPLLLLATLGISPPTIASSAESASTPAKLR